MSSKIIWDLPISKLMFQHIIQSLEPCIKSFGSSRNSDITLKYLAGVSQADLAAEYGISALRIRQICVSTIRLALSKASKMPNIEELEEENTYLRARIASLESNLKTYLENLDNLRLCVCDRQKTKIDHKSITLRLSNVIKGIGIEFWEDFSKLNTDELLRYRHVGRKSLMELKEILTARGIKLKDND